MTKYLNFFESESGFTEAVEAGQLFYPNVSYTEDDDTVHWNLTQPANPVETPMLRMSFSTSSPGQEVNLRKVSPPITAMEIDGIPASGGTYSIASPGNHTAVYQFASPKIPEMLFFSDSGAFDTFTSAEIISPVTEIGNTAFNNCRGLTSVTIPDSVTTISVQAFAGSGLRSVTVPDTVTTLSAYPFFHCTEMRMATIGSGVTVIPYQTFAECTSLQYVTLPGNLTAIGPEAFRDCPALYNINIPSGVTRIYEYAFENCSGLTAIYLNPETPPTLGAAALAYTNECPIYVPAASVEAYKQAWPECASRIMPMSGVQYSISASVNDDSLGTVVLPQEQETASEGDTVDFHVIVFDESRPYQVSVTDGNGNNVQVTDEGDNSYSFTMPASDVTIFVTIGERPEYNITASVNDETLGEVNVYEETAPEGEWVAFQVIAFEERTYQVSVTDGNGDEVQVTDEGDGFYGFDMPASDVTIFVTIGEKPEYNITASVNDDSLGEVNVQETAPEGDTVGFDVFVYEPEQYQVSSLTVTDGNGDEVQVTGDEDYGNFRHYTFDMPASDVTIEATIEPVE